MKPDFAFTSNKIVAIVFVLTFILVSALVVTTEKITETTLDKAAEMVNQQYQMQHNLMNLHIAGQSRTVNLQRILLSSDPFKKDEALMSLYKDGMYYTLHRDQLAELVKKSPNGQQWMTQIREMALETGPLHNQIAQMAMNGQENPAKALLLTQGIKNLNRFSDQVKAFSNYQAQVIQNSIKQARSQVNQLMQSVMILASSLIAMAMLFSFFLTRRFNQVHRQLQHSHATLEKKVQARTQELTQAKNELLIHNQKLEQLSTTDPLTQLDNRLKIEHVLDELLIQYQEKRVPFCMLLIDIDHFKSINDDFGHLAGDEVLKAFSSLLKEFFGKETYMGRWGGEEFIIISPNTSLDSKRHRAEAFREKVANHSFPKVSRLTFSGGIACIQPSETLSELIHRADMSLYKAKHQGRNLII